MSDRPILFSAPMINAMSAGRKTQTRSLLAGFTPPDNTPADATWELEDGPKIEQRDPQIWQLWSPIIRDTKILMGRCKVRYAVGDRLYVREEWKSTPAYDDLKPSDMGGDEPIYYPADGATFNWAEADGERLGRRRPGMHMPRWASRLTLIVEAVRVERLQAVSEADAEAEGILWQEPTDDDRARAKAAAEEGEGDGTIRGVWIAPGTECGFGPKPRCPLWGPTAATAYRALWNSLHDKTGERWDNNPFVVAVSFRVVRGNIDQVPA